jgi:hypothetical protein
MDEGFTVRRRDELERTGKWLLARRSLGLSAFGLNVVESVVLEGSPSWA